MNEEYVIEQAKKYQLAITLFLIMAMVFLTTLTILAYKHQQIGDFWMFGSLDLLAAGFFAKLIQISRLP